MDVFAEHGIAGVVGLLFNALFAADYVIGLDGVNTGLPVGGWLNHNYKQLYIQVAYIVACGAYSFVMSAIIAYAIDYLGKFRFLGGMGLRASEEAELLGMDDDQLGEFAYDYVEVRRDYLAWTPAGEGGSKEEVEVDARDRFGIEGHGDMIQGESIGRSRGTSVAHSQNGNGGLTHTGMNHSVIQGDRHGMAVHEQEKQQRIDDEKSTVVG